MICKVCGTNNEDYLEYCKKCSAPLHGSDNADNGAEAPASPRSFVRSPVWAKPEFNANTISENDIPADFLNGKAEETVQPAQPAQPAQQPRQSAVQSGPVCPKCGARLIEGQRFCNSCGARIGDAVSAAAVSAASSAWSGSYSTPQQPSKSGIKYADPIDDRMFSYDYTETDDRRSKRAGGNKKAAPAQRPVSRTAPRTSAPRKSQPSRRRRSSLNIKLLAMILGGILLLGAIVFGVIKLVSGGIGSGKSVYAKKKSIVRFEGGSIVKEEPISGKSVTFGIPEQLWIPSEPVDPDELTADGYLAVTPNITVINKKGESEPVTFANPILISIPTIDMTVTSPNTENFSVSSPIVEVAGVVQDTTAGIYVNDEAVPVDETGSFTYTYTITEAGTTTLNIEARKNGYAINRKTFTVDYNTAGGGTTAPTGGGTTAATTPAKVGDAKSIYYANTDGINVRANAVDTSDVLGQLGGGDKVYVISADSNGWYKIAYNNTTAYVSGKYLTKVSDIASYTTTNATVNTDNLNARLSPSTSGTAMMQLANGTAVAFVKDMGSGWSMIEYNGKILFVSQQYITKN